MQLAAVVAPLVGPEYEVVLVQAPAIALATKRLVSLAVSVLLIELEETAVQPAILLAVVVATAAVGKFLP